MTTVSIIKDYQLYREHSGRAELIGIGNKGSDCYLGRRKPERLIYLLAISGDEHVPNAPRRPKGGVATAARLPGLETGDEHSGRSLIEAIRA
jgi:hypothetical protein